MVLVPKMLMLPREAQLPKGPRRDYVEELFLHYREAGRPTLRAISAWIDEKNANVDTELGASASIETIRRVMTGVVIPRNWKTVQAIFLALCGIAERDPEQVRWSGGFNDDEESFRAVMKRYWNDALDDIALTGSLPAKPQPPAAAKSGFSGDPWENARPKSSFDDEPPF